MKALFTSLFFFSSLLSISQPSNPANKTFALPNVRAVEGNYLYAAVSEVSNLQYMEFLYHIRKEGEELYKANLPDTTCWMTDLAYNEPYVDYYFRHPAYNNYPVVGVTREQAEAYCSWLTKKLNEILPEHDSEVKKVLVRLPTETEWEDAARGFWSNIEYPWGHDQLRSQSKKHQGNFLANFKDVRYEGQSMTDFINNSVDLTSPIYSYWTNDYGLYNMSGNVAEMVSDKPVIKGGSWRTTAFYLKIGESLPLPEKPAPDVGFRYFIEVLELAPEEREKKLQNLSIKELEKGVASINDSLFVSKYEVTNRLYSFFTAHSEAQEVQINRAGWAGLASTLHQQEYGFHTNYDAYPVVNISHSGAEQFCAWLTEFYNSSKKRKYQKVVFRLPTAEEWETAARAGRDYSIFPWGGPYYRNSKGQFLCNFHPRELQYMKEKNQNGKIFYDYPNGDMSGSRSLDGGYFTLPVDSYTPNDFGLYNMAGNAAEMIADKSITKGGSWNSFDTYIQISATETISGPNPFTGFRYVMEVIEE